MLDNYFDCVMHDRQSWKDARVIYPVRSMESFKEICCEDVRWMELAQMVGFENNDVEHSGCKSRK